MRRLPLYAMTALAAVAMTGTLTVTSQAAVKTYIIGGNGNYVNGQLAGWNGHKHTKPITDCLEHILPDMNKPVLPDVIQPVLPDMNKPVLPDMNQPVLPDTDQPVLPDTDQPVLPENENTQSSFALQVADLVNEERSKAGLDPLTVDSRVAAAADVRAREIETSFSHNRPDGSSFSTALAENGINYRGSGENIAYGQRTPQEVMDGWMKSAGHRANILNKDFTSIGVGYHQNGAGTGYWVQLFTY